MNLTDQDRIEMAADNCEVPRARLAKYEDDQGNPKSRPSGVVLPERMTIPAQASGHTNGKMVGWNACLDEVDRLNSSPVSAGDDDDQAYDAEAERLTAEVLGVGAGINPNATSIDDIFPDESAVGVDELLDWFEELLGGYDWLGTGSDQAAADADQAEAWEKWAELRAALSAPSHGEQVRAWNLAVDALPACGKPVLAYYLNSHGMGRRIRAEYIAAWTVQADDVSDPDTECVEYSEQDDAYYIQAGWYELVDNWDDYSRIAVTEGVITRWMLMPASPAHSDDHSADDLKMVKVPRELTEHCARILKNANSYTIAIRELAAEELRTLLNGGRE